MDGNGGSPLHASGRRPRLKVSLSRKDSQAGAGPIGDSRNGNTGAFSSLFFLSATPGLAEPLAAKEVS